MLEIKHLSKSYRGKTALCNVNLKLKCGMYGLLGPNGAGKSTLMNIITDNLLADSGEVLWNGDPTIQLGRGFRRLLGYAPQQQGLYEGFTGRRFLNYLSTLKEIPKPQIADEVERVARLVNLTAQLDKRLGAYSGGMKQRILVAQAVLGDPQLLILDEPTAGLDPKERVRIRGLLSSLAQERIVVTATHVVSDIETIADHVIILKQGSVVAMDPPERLIERYKQSKSLEEVYMQLFEFEEETSL